jgi:hypothetical protein
VKTFTESHDALAWINAHPRPLAAYYFGNDKVNQATFIANTTSGAAVINDVMTHAAIDSLPFGGVGASGMGRITGYTVSGVLVIRNRSWYRAKMAPLTCAWAPYQAKPLISSHFYKTDFAPVLQHYREIAMKVLMVLTSQ